MWTRTNYEEIYETIHEGKIAESKLASDNAILDDEKQHLLKSIKKGKQTREQLILDNMDIVYSVAEKNYEALGCEYDECVQNGCVGLIKAIDAYNLSSHNFRAYIARCVFHTTVRMGKDSNPKILLHTRYDEYMGYYKDRQYLLEPFMTAEEKEMAADVEKRIECVKFFDTEEFDDPLAYDTADIAEHNIFAEEVKSFFDRKDIIPTDEDKEFLFTFFSDESPSREEIANRFGLDLKGMTNRKNKLFRKILRSGTGTPNWEFFLNYTTEGTF